MIDVVSQTGFATKTSLIQLQNYFNYTFGFQVFRRTGCRQSCDKRQGGKPTITLHSSIESMGNILFQLRW